LRWEKEAKTKTSTSDQTVSCQGWELDLGRDLVLRNVDDVGTIVRLPRGPASFSFALPCARAAVITVDDARPIKEQADYSVML